MVGKAVSLAAVALSVPLALAAAAAANWGTDNECGLTATNVNEHCYVYATDTAHRLSAIDYVDTESIYVPPGGFYLGEDVNNEMWVMLYNGQWIEAGNTARNGPGVPGTTTVPFYNVVTAAESVEYIGTAPVAQNIEGPGGHHYALYIISDANADGCWHVYFTFAQAHETCGLATYSERLNAGLEAGTSEQPGNSARQIVATTNASITNSSHWHPWDVGEEYGKYDQDTNVLCMSNNAELPIPGNIAWSIC